MDPSEAVCSEHGGPLRVGCSKCTLEALMIMMGEHPQMLSLGNAGHMVLAWGLLTNMLDAACAGKTVIVQVSSTGPQHTHLTPGYDLQKTSQTWGALTAGDLGYRPHVPSYPAYPAYSTLLRP